MIFELRKFPEIYVTYCSYKADEGKDTRSAKQFIGSVKDLVELIKDEPLDTFTIEKYNCYTEQSLKDMFELSITLNNCYSKAKPFTVGW